MNAFLWYDRWGSQPLAIEAPELFSYARNKMMSSVQRAFNADDTSDLFHLPLSHIAFDQLQVLQQRIIHRPLSDQDDSWIYAWGSNIYASTKVYKLLMGHSELHPVFKWIWKNQCQPKHKVFFGYLLMTDLVPGTFLEDVIWSLTPILVCCL